MANLLSSMGYHQCSAIAAFFFLLIFQGLKDHSADGESSQVKFLPGFDGPLPFELETGYIGVEEGENAQLFFYFVKSGSDPLKDPLILWLIGGPGCSSLSALAAEMGPLLIDMADDGGLPIMTLNPHAFTQAANIIFVDLPVGTGFSYAKTPEAAHSTGLQSCEHAYQFLQKWLVEHPEFISNPFYVGGLSYTGLTVPVIVHLISNGNEAGNKPWINLKGYMVGNPGTFPEEANYRIPFAHGMGLIPDDLYESLKQNCKGNYMNVDPCNTPCLEDVQTFHQLVDGLFDEHILDYKCSNLPGKRRYEELHNNSQLSPKCHTVRYEYFPLWANDPSVQEALHVRKGTSGTWVRCNYSIPYTNTAWDSTLYHAILHSKGYRSLIYSGDHDMVVPLPSTQAWIKSLNYPITEEWRPWFVDEQIAGYTRIYAYNMTFATIKGGAHLSSMSHPMECLIMFKKWISHLPL